jgi:hypothetical protein
MGNAPARATVATADASFEFQVIRFLLFTFLRTTPYLNVGKMTVRLNLD